MLGLADIQFDVLRLCALADDHTGIYLFARSDEQGAAVLCVEEAISNRFAGFKCDQRSLAAVLQVSLVRAIAVEDCIHDTISLCISHKIATVADQSTGRD